LLTERDEALWQRLLGKVLSQHGEVAREAACRAAEKYTEYVIRATNHEAMKALGPLEVALTNLIAGLERPKFDRGRCLERARLAQRRLNLLLEILESLERFVTEVTPVHRPENLKDMLREAAALVRERAPKGRRLKVKLDVPRGLVLDAHRVRLVLAFANLLQNALEAYGDRTGSAPVTVSVKSDDSARTISLSFRDNGRGFSEGGLAQAFRIYATTKPRGLGFGLAFTRRVVEVEHRGGISIKSREGEGATIKITLPFEQLPGGGA
jgi:signal transduction histidine kinase